MQQHRMVRALHLQEMASSLDTEAATWRLLWHLYGPGTRAYLGGAGAPQLPGCAGAPTLAQQIAAILEQDTDANRCSHGALHAERSMPGTVRSCCAMLQQRCNLLPLGRPATVLYESLTQRATRE